MQLFLLNEDGESVWVNIEEICLIAPTAAGPAFTAANGALYRFPHTMEQLVQHFAGYGFDRLDRNAVVNMDAVKGYDPVQRKVYFDLPENRGDEGLYATVSGANVDKVKHMIIRESACQRSAYSAA
ncbi:LytTR family transcriptional regulator DNA-binding domain-containing protein [Paenibacillus sacheonensis]|uniref:HTH LytTR-type domain-containing protein n=1 Tax=Paenibacillus sacheonensis TaxID=742054 RepID=A0A7X5C0W8_9BACL|nr:LytTR family transcriptional regulator DNA-binding domain-containing protein [Paenibacillus sacheonensis]MBM7565367.1 DNA-binding LytR/AlgR family response regulator [Paenibacillus sacheonensis]NBC69705.1 hypothetical protein [Paenibacillus sacheonensis]